MFHKNTSQRNLSWLKNQIVPKIKLKNIIILFIKNFKVDIFAILSALAAMLKPHLRNSTFILEKWKKALKKILAIYFLKLEMQHTLKKSTVSEKMSSNTWQAKCGSHRIKT
ncbi:hypothetical protein [Bartonella tribocorum]|uniref:Uncharacterized protein n=1 Tax=Bartonella tribocorum TaxID=85701 RepID=A0A2M6UR85_9HYPH|nr:hypothetical protein [Bartonella tribocorum]PIT68691.1 hypothetical protein CEV08_07595 [Bartonella tribocorum]